MRCARLVTAQDARDLRELAQQSDGRRAHARGSGARSRIWRRERNLWVISDEAYEDVVFDGSEHMSIASLPGMYERTIPLYTFSKTYAMTGLRLAYIAVHDPRDSRSGAQSALLHRLQHVIADSVRRHRRALGIAGRGRRISARTGGPARAVLCGTCRDVAGGVLSGAPPAGAFYAFLKIDPAWRSPLPDAPASPSWAMTEFLIKRGRIGCVPGVDFGPHGEGYVRFCFARERQELEGALESMATILALAIG